MLIGLGMGLSAGVASAETTGDGRGDDGAPAASAREADAASDEQTDEDEPSPWEFEFGGYGSLDFAYHDYGPDPTREGGSREDSRVTFDQTRLALILEGQMPADLELEAEVEFEHGGAGSALELEYEEFGEYESEVEKGGEVLVEEFYLEKGFGEHVSAKVGRFYVAVGLLSELYRPTAYLGTGRPVAETTLLPGVWDEMGAAVELEFDSITGTLQLVNGLDSTGFSSQYWIASGHQSRFEEIRATALAGVGRVDVTPIEGLTFGASAYYGGTSANRPKSDMARDCDGGNPERQVAPCGYVNAPVFIGDLHVVADLDPVRFRAVGLYGELQNADVISEQNRSLSNNLDVLRSAVSDRALATWAEVGLDVAPWVGLGGAHRLQPYSRVEYVDTVFEPREGLEDNARFERFIVSAGASYTYRDFLITKLDWSRRGFGSDALNTEHSISLEQGIVF